MDGGAWWAAVHGVVKSQTRLSDFTLTFHFNALEKEMATHSSVLAWRIPGMAEPGGLLSMGSHRVGHDWSDLAAAAVSYLFIEICRFILVSKHLMMSHTVLILAKTPSFCQVLTVIKQFCFATTLNARQMLSLIIMSLNFMNVMTFYSFILHMKFETNI